jgi:hypothetical protein
VTPVTVKGSQELGRLALIAVDSPFCTVRQIAESTVHAMSLTAYFSSR